MLNEFRERGVRFGSFPTSRKKGEKWGTHFLWAHFRGMRFRATLSLSFDGDQNLKVIGVLFEALPDERIIWRLGIS
jgi:hypothetical protein